MCAWENKESCGKTLIFNLSNINVIFKSSQKKNKSVFLAPCMLKLNAPPTKRGQEYKCS